MSKIKILYFVLLNLHFFFFKEEVLGFAADVPEVMSEEHGCCNAR